VPLSNPIISRVAPVKVGGAANAGAGWLASAFDHSHPLIETAGPTNLTPGAILDGDTIRRVGAGMVGRLLRASSSLGGSANSLVTPIDTSGNLTFSLPLGNAYIALWLISYTTAAATTGIMLSVNFTGTSSGNQRFGVLTATGANTMFSQTSTVFDTLLGMPAVGPGSTPRVALIYCRLGVDAVGNLALRHASGVGASSATVGSESCGIVIQQ